MHSYQAPESKTTIHAGPVSRDTGRTGTLVQFAKPLGKDARHSFMPAMVGRNAHTLQLKGMQETVSRSARVGHAVQLQAMADNYSRRQHAVQLVSSPSSPKLKAPASITRQNAPIQLGRRNKKADWNPKQHAQNARLLERRERRAREERERAEARRAATMAGMKKAQKTSFEAQPAAIQAGIVSLHAKGFVQQASSGRAVFNKAGNFADCKAAAQEVFGALGANQEDGVAVNAAGAVKERYSINWQGITVIVRNFSSNAAILGTIEIQTGVVFEFKYA